jgi:hypothetical protein
VKKSIIMNFEHLKSLLDKYFEGETTLEEEQLLLTYFNSTDIDSRLQQYQPLFQFFKAEKAIEMQVSEGSIRVVAYPKLEAQNPKPLKILRGGNLWLKGMAAMLILTVGSFFLIKTLYKPKDLGLAENNRIVIYDENDDPEKAFEEVQAALKLVSKKMRKGENGAKAGMKKVKKATDEVHKILKND